MKLLVVVQRYGDVAGGAEAHARMLVRRLAPHVEVTVATTTAGDYWKWEEAFPAGETTIDGIRVLRFPVAHGRARDFGRRQRAAYAAGHSLEQERAFIEAQGPIVPELLEHLFARGRDYDVALFFTYLYYPTVYGLPLVPERAILVPTAHDEPPLRLSVYRALFHAPRAIAFNSEEERALVQGLFRNARIPSEIVGVGVDAPARGEPDRFRTRFGIGGPFFFYLGRIVGPKGIPELLELWSRWRNGANGRRATLVLGGDAEMALPKRDDVVFAGRLSDEEKFDAYAGCAAFLMPSRLESLSLVTLEAWASGKPVVVDAESPVVASMSRRAHAGLPYRSYGEFAEILDLLLERPEVGAALGRSGQAFVASTYTWPRVVETYLDLFAEVRARNA